MAQFVLSVSKAGKEVYAYRHFTVYIIRVGILTARRLKMRLYWLARTYYQLIVLVITLIECFNRVSHAFVVMENNDANNTVCNQTNPCSNLQPALVEMTSGSKLIISAGDNYTLSYDDAMTMYGMDSIVIVGEGSDNTVITCDSNAGLAFINMLNITIANLTLKECGAWRYSTTQNGTNNSTFEFQCGVYFLDCRDVVMYDVIVTDGPGTGVMMYDTVGTVTIANSQFIRNRVPKNNVDDIPGGGGVYIEFSYCKPNATDFTSCSPSLQANATYTIVNSTFMDNYGTTVKQESTKFISPLKGSHEQFGRGGAVSVHFKGHSQNNTINVIDCYMAHNQAVWGAGLLIDVLDFAWKNRVIVKNVHFFHNLCPIDLGTGGGAIRIHYFPQVNSPSNTINITDSVFDSNSAYYGGGISLSTNRERGVLYATNGITLRGCIWRNNVARAGSAVDLSSYHDVPEGQLVIPIFENCSYFHNNNSYTDMVVKALGLGTIHSDGIPLVFSGDNYFEGNNGTALAATDVIIDFRENATAKFIGNRGLRGGAIALFGTTVLRMYPNTELQFIGNKAADRGGAIYSVSVGLRDVVNSRKCFIRYHNYVLGPRKWKTKFIFTNNTSSNPGHAIYCTTLIPCSWDKSSIVTTPEVLKRTFRWKKIFKYDNDDSNTIATDPAFNDFAVEMLQFAPGQAYNLNFSIKDDTGVTRQTVLFAQSSNETVARVADTSAYFSDNIVKVQGSPGNPFKLDFQTISTRVLSFSLNSTLAKCPPGFYLFQNDDRSTSTCRCSVYDDNEKYNDIPYCDEVAFRAFIQPQFWVGYTRDDVLVTGRCPPGYCFSNNSIIELPSEARNEQLDQLICSPQNRQGVLCGRCKEGYYIYANSKYYDCGDCTASESGIVVQIFAKFVPLYVFLFTIILLDVNLASGHLNTFVFFCQILPFLDLYASGQIPIPSAAKPFVEFYQFCYNIFNLEYFESLDSFPGVCTFNYETALTVTILDYLVAFNPVIVIFIVWLIMYTSDYCVFMGKRNIVGKFSHHLRRIYRKVKPNKNVSLSESFFRGLVTFLVLSYSKFSLVTLSILTPAYLSGPGGKNYNIVAELDGTLEYFGHGHLLYAFPAILVLIFIVLLPLAVLAMYPRMCSWLGIHVHKMMPFFDSLNGAFKHDCYYFALLYFVYRLILVAIFTFTPNIQLQYTLQQVFCVAVLLIHVMKRPYKKDKHNNVDIALLGLIPAVISISFYQLFIISNYNSNRISQFGMAIQIILLYLPLLYVATNTVYYMYKWKRGYKESDGSLSQLFIDIPARVLESVHYTEYGDDRPKEQYEVYNERIADKKF